MPSREITYTTRNNETFTGYYTYPNGHGPFPGIVLITAIWGTDEEMKELADAWAADGFVVSVPDIFWRVWPGPTADRDVAFAHHGNAEIVVYPEAAHNFAMPDKAGYQEAAAKASRAAVPRCFQNM